MTQTFVPPPPAPAYYDIRSHPSPAPSLPRYLLRDTQKSKLDHSFADKWISNRWNQQRLLYNLNMGRKSVNSSSLALCNDCVYSEKGAGERWGVGETLGNNL